MDGDRARAVAKVTEPNREPVLGSSHEAYRRRLRSRKFRLEERLGEFIESTCCRTCFLHCASLKNSYRISFCIKACLVMFVWFLMFVPCALFLEGGGSNVGEEHEGSFGITINLPNHFLAVYSPRPPYRCCNVGPVGVDALNIPIASASTTTTMEARDSTTKAASPGRSTFNPQRRIFLIESDP